MLQPLLIICLSKSWSDEARAAALAARGAKAEGAGNPRQAAAVAKSMVRRGSSVEDAVKEAIKVSGGGQQRTLGLKGGGAAKEKAPKEATDVMSQLGEAMDSYSDITLELAEENGWDPQLHVPHSALQVEGDTVRINSDDGNESSYGSEEWQREGSDMVLKDVYGRDTFEENYADKIGATVGTKVPVAEFVEGVKNHLEGWRKTGERAVALGIMRDTGVPIPNSWKEIDEAAEAFLESRRK